MMLLEAQSITWPTIGLCLSIVASAAGITAALWKLIVTTVNGHLARFADGLMKKLDAQTSSLNAKLEGQTQSLGVVMKEEGASTRQTLRDLIPQRR